MSAHPKCSVCGKTLFAGKHVARLASRGAGNRIRIYPAHGGWHITDNEKNEESYTKRHRKRRIPNA